MYWWLLVFSIHLSRSDLGIKLGQMKWWCARNLGLVCSLCSKTCLLPHLSNITMHCYIILRHFWQLHLTLSKNVWLKLTKTNMFLRCEVIYFNWVRIVCLTVLEKIREHQTNICLKSKNTNQKKNQSTYRWRYEFE